MLLRNGLYRILIAPIILENGLNDLLVRMGLKTLAASIETKEKLIFYMIRIGYMVYGESFSIVIDRLTKR